MTDMAVTEQKCPKKGNASSGTYGSYGERIV